jgi:hypothetical protein
MACPAYQRKGCPLRNFVSGGTGTPTCTYTGAGVFYGASSTDAGVAQG